MYKAYGSKLCLGRHISLNKVWKYQRDNQGPNIKDMGMFIANMGNKIITTYTTLLPDKKWIFYLTGSEYSIWQEVNVYLAGSEYFTWWAVNVYMTGREYSTGQEVNVYLTGGDFVPHVDI